MEQTDIYNNIRQIVLNTKEPLIIKDQMKCDLTLWNLDDWNKTLGNELLQFRCGKNQYTQVRHINIISFVSFTECIFCRNLSGSRHVQKKKPHLMNF